MCQRGRTFQISIHAPREGSDRLVHIGRKADRRFQSTLPARGATYDGVLLLVRQPYFNPRSPRGERRRKGDMGLPHGNFNPRSPRGERHIVNLDILTVSAFQSTLPARGATTTRRAILSLKRFQSTLPARGATTWDRIKDVVEKLFQSTLPARGAT